ncbi:MAG TPA: TonB-dependent receptor [Bryobacteraceae bacterium]|nr:TonB-dependent receptor [Bryobacteraceae bacterium]
MNLRLHQRTRWWVTLTIGMFLTLGLAVPMLPQATTGSIVGRVSDPSGARVPDAVVTARNEATGLVQRTSTNAVGEYVLGALPPGAYRLTVAKAHFVLARLLVLRLALDQKTRMDVVLTLETASGEQTVDARRLDVDTQSGETGEVIAPRQILDLPLLGRNYLDLARLSAGVVGGAGGNTLNVAVNGQREFANSVLVNGVEVSSNRNNDTTIRPSVDSVEEFKVLTSAYPAEFGRASGAVIAVVTKSGSNQVHGSLYEFFRGAHTAARSFFSSDASPLQQHNFGATLGGPVKQNRTFLFGSYEGVRLRNAFSFLDSVPPSSQIGYTSGGSVDLSALQDPLTGRQIPIFDPSAYATSYSALPFAGNLIPAARVSAAGEAVLRNFFPATTLPGTLNGWFGNFISRQAYRYDSDTAGVRLDEILSVRDRLSLVYHYGSFISVLGDRFAGSIPVAGGGDADYGDHENSRDQQVSISETRLLSDRWLNQSRFGYTRYRLDQLSLLDGENLAAQYGIGNINVSGDENTSGFPDIYLGFGAQTGGSTYKPLYFLDSNYQLSDTLAAQWKAHQFKGGAEIRRLSSNPLFSIYPTGFQFYGGPGLSLTGDPNYGFYDSQAFYYNGGSDVADLLLGLPYTVNLGRQLTNPLTRSWETSWFLEDTWQISPRFVVSYGLRYEYFSPWVEASDFASNVDLSTGEILIAGRGGNSRSLVSPDRNNFAPRLGVVYRLTPDTTIRAGWGIYYSPENDAREDVLTKNYPFAVQQTIFNNIYGGLPFSYSLDIGVPRVQTIPLASGAARLSPADILKAGGAPPDLYAVDARLRVGYSELYNVTLQRKLGSDLTLEAAYVGSVSRKLPYAVGNLNGDGRLSESLGQVQTLFSEGSASFHSLQVKMARRFSENLSFLAAYTFGKNLDNGPAPFNLGHNLNGNNEPQSPFDLSLERAVADDDVRHSMTASFMYELPFGKGRRYLGGLSGPARAILGGWQINGIFAARSGLPVNVVRNAQLKGLEGLRPDVLSDPNLPSSERSLSHYFDTSAFTAARFTGAAKAVLGDAGRNLVRGPGLANLEFSAFKEMPLHEQLRLQLRFEFFNVTNTPHFANPDGNMSDSGFGGIVQTIGNPRIVQLAAKVLW